MCRGRLGRGHRHRGGHGFRGDVVGRPGQGMLSLRYSTVTNVVYITLLRGDSCRPGMIEMTVYDPLPLCLHHALEKWWHCRLDGDLNRVSKNELPMALLLRKNVLRMHHSAVKVMVHQGRYERVQGPYKLCHETSTISPGLTSRGGSMVSTPKSRLGAICSSAGPLAKEAQVLPPPVLAGAGAGAGDGIAGAGVGSLKAKN